MFALNIDPMNPAGNPPASELSALGVRMVRYTFKDFVASSYPTPEQLYFYTMKIDEYTKAGIQSLLILSYETYPGGPGYEASDEAWNEYIYFYTNRVMQIAQSFAPWEPAFQICNEPESPPQPGSAPSLRESVYGRMLAQAREAVKSVHPNLTVAGAGLASGDPSWWRRVVDSTPPGTPLLDVNCIHPYGQRPEP